MKIGIMSYQQVRNFGAVLQNYALQKTIEKLNNAEVETIDYRCRYLDKGYNKRMLHNGSRGIVNYSMKDLIKFIKIYPLYIKREKIFEDYLNAHLKRSSIIREREELKKIKDEYDYFIVGSDQVWNLEIIHDDFSYFLDFVDDPRKKVSYAASVCWKYTHQKKKEVLYTYLNDFKYISVREEKDALKLKEGINKNINVNIDPTLLLTSKEWKYAETEVVKKPHEYILFFELLDANVAADLARMRAKELNIPIVYISSDDKTWKHKDMIHIHNVSPGQFVNLLRNAQSVYTNSYHGVMFSLLFHKPFYCQQTYGDKRMEDALKLVGLGNYYIRDEFGINLLSDMESLWYSFENTLSIKRKISIEYLEKCFIND